MIDDQEKRKKATASVRRESRERSPVRLRPDQGKKKKGEKFAPNVFFADLAGERMGKKGGGGAPLFSVCPR